MNLFRELRRRKVLSAAGIYVVGAWVAIQVASLAFPAIGVPEAGIRYVWIAALLLFPLVLVFSWLFQVTASGLVRTPHAERTGDTAASLGRVDAGILGLLALLALAITWHSVSGIRSLSTYASSADLTAGPGRYPIAVLPLADVSSAQGNPYFASGIHEAVIVALSRIPELQVTSKTSTVHYRDRPSVLADVADALGVSRLVQGTVARAGNWIAVNLSLFEADEDRETWSGRFEGSLADIATLQADIGRALAEQVTGSARNAPATAPQLVNPAAYEAFLHGQFLLERFTPQDMQQAGAHFTRAVEMDPELALAHWGLSKLCAFQAQAGMISPEQARERCLPPVVTAIRLDPFLPEAHLGYAAHMTWQRFDWAQARPAFEKAIELNPSYAEGRMFYSHYLGIIGELEQSGAQMAMARELDPLNPFVKGLAGVQRWMAGDAKAAISLLEASMADSPGFGFGNNVLWFSYDHENRHDDAVAAAVRWLRRFDADHPAARALLSEYASGDYAAASSVAADVLLQSLEEHPVPPITVGRMLEHAGRYEESVDWYRIAYERRDPDAPYLGAVVKRPEVNTHPRFVALLREMRLDAWIPRAPP